MSADLFISYAWTSDSHRKWVRLLAAQLKALGFDVLIDADVDYGDSLTGFMRKVTEARQVLIIADANYVRRADHSPDSGVAIENRWIAQVHGKRPAAWAAVLFKDNPEYLVPAWLKGKNPKGHSFNADVSAGEFPGSEQIEDLWRWVEGLPANRDAATSIATIRERAGRLERHRLRSEPSQWRSPALAGQVCFSFNDAPQGSYFWGLGEYEFTLMVTGCGLNSVYLYSDPSAIAAVGVIREDHATNVDLEAHLFPGRSLVVEEGQVAVLMNRHGAFSRVHIDKVQRESTGPPYIAPYVEFRWEVVT